MDDVSRCGAECVGRRLFVVQAAHKMLHGTAIVSGLVVLTPIFSLQASGDTRRTSVQYPIPLKDGVSIDTANEVILCRYQSRVFAFVLACPHQNTALRALKDSKGFQCPRHKSKYQPDGVFISGKATRNMDRLAIARSGDRVVVDMEVAYASDSQPREWAAAMVTVE